jgi:crotonobetaine/carnitine-CoA ligase
VQRTIPALFRAAVDEAPHKTWLVTDGAQLSYEQALDLVTRAASALRSTGVRPGDHVLVTARNTPQYLLVWFAVMELGAVQIPVNPELSHDELAGLITQVRPAVVVTDGERTDAVAAAKRAAGSAALVVDVASLYEAAAAARGPATVDPSDVAVMIPTSGTTGRSKLVMQTHLAYVLAGEGFPWWMSLTADDRLMTSLPLFHLNAPAYSTLGSVAARASLVLLPRFSAHDFFDAARRLQATEFNAIGAMLEILMRQPPRPDDADNPLRLCYTGPSPDRERQETIEARFGLRIVCGYALSESPYGLIWRHGTRPFGTLGSPRQHPALGHVNDARVVEAGRPVAAGEVGELQLRNPAIMKGYFEMPEETASVLVGGWLRTGDLVRDNGDGTYTFVGRAKDVIRRRGENLSPLEVEAVLERFPAVAEAAVVAVPSELSEEEVKAFLVAQPGTAVDVFDVQRDALDHLAPFKVPRYFEVVTELPHTPTGRIAKHRLPTGRTAGEVDMERPRQPPEHGGDESRRP